ncbi:hypothetical protein K466DRAFT_569892 [Polyporus arcularius HHB13444]|uniref:Uncharacterized protein n=1 Tax=Polyporus arcularius HHB13444 TaxID=1314778 RepID=A0A5C3NS17_9APHY|nr:hypothetical protein K466DRAFT_569892 [Polyporus arcularius HHB13444]
MLTQHHALILLLISSRLHAPSYCPPLGHCPQAQRTTRRMADSFLRTLNRSIQSALELQPAFSSSQLPGTCTSGSAAGLSVSPTYGGLVKLPRQWTAVACMQDTHAEENIYLSQTYALQIGAGTLGMILRPSVSVAD